jgi:serine/threonine-protein kinase HipA
MHFQDEVAIVVERFDRVRTAAGLRRVHQEDMCQALSIPPTRKYENEGGPGIRDIVDFLKTYSTNPVEDVTTFLDSVAYNWLIAGTDAHGKNYALLIGAQARVRLAPLYDVASMLPCGDIDIDRVKLSMKIGNEYRLRNIRSYHWRKLAEALRLDPDATIKRVHNFAEQLADHIPDVSKRMTDEGLTHSIIPRLAGALIERAAACRRILDEA